jgi:hypothetical protein
MEDMYGVLVVIVLLFVVNITKNHFNKTPKKIDSTDRNCPPHKWDFELQPGMENVYYTRCKLCKKLAGRLDEK